MELNQTKQDLLGRLLRGQRRMFQTTADNSVLERLEEIKRSNESTQELRISKRSSSKAAADCAPDHS